MPKDNSIAHFSLDWIFTKLHKINNDQHRAVARMLGDTEMLKELEKSVSKNALTTSLHEQVKKSHDISDTIAQSPLMGMGPMLAPSGASSSLFSDLGMQAAAGLINGGAGTIARKRE